jgi:tetratricopeptide (TPR) repeat protein
MLRALILSLSLAWLGGCSCKGTPAQATSTPPASPVRQQEAPPPEEPPTPPVPEGAARLHLQGREAGQVGRFEEALQHFAQAQALAPGWHLPLYDIGYTYLLMGEDARALEAYERLDALAPQGFSDARRILDCLRRERDGRVPAGTYRKYLEVQPLRDLEEIRRRLEALTRSVPSFYPAWQELAAITSDTAEAERMVAKALALEPETETRGHLRVHRVELLRRRGEHEAARAQLQALLDEPDMAPGVKVLAREALHLPGLP